MREKQAHGTSSTANVGEQRGTFGNMLTILREPAVQVLHIRELTTTSSIAIITALMLTQNSFATELELKPAFDNPGIQVASITFLPDWLGEGNSGEINMDANRDSKWCEKQGFTYYSSGKCPAYHKQETCSRDKKYLKCDAVQWCKDNGYNTTSCSIPNYLETICPNNQPYYKGCKEDTARACKDLGYKNSCSSGQKLHASSGRCSYNNSYGTCCAPSGCPANTSLSGSYGSAGSQDGCGYACYYTCNMNCPSGTSTSNPGGCGGSTRNGCNTKTCYYPYQSCCTPTCSDDWSTCSCGTYYISDGCGSSCRRCSACCSHSNHVSCSYGCASTCPCDGQCSSCKSGDDCKSYYYEEQSSNGWCDFLNGGPKVIVCGKRKYCTTYSGSSKYISISYRAVGGPFYGSDAQQQCEAAKGSGNNCN